MGLGIGDLYWKLRLVTWIGDWDLGLMIRIDDWDQNLGLGIDL